MRLKSAWNYEYNNIREVTSFPATQRHEKVAHALA